MATAESPRSLLTVEDLVSTTSLGVTVMAGQGGLDRQVLWAHSCEMERPERWLGPHELLMTVGLGVPVAPAEQAEFIARLDDAGLAGLMIGNHDLAPPISTQMLTEADARSFPVLFVAEETPYAVVARHVAAAHSSSQIQQVLKLSKLYQVAASADDDTAALTRDLALLLGIGISIVDGLTGIAIVGVPGPHAAEHTGDHATDEPSAAKARTFPLRGDYQVELRIEEPPGEILESLILVHLMKVIEVSVEGFLAAADHRVRASADALANLLSSGSATGVEELLDPYRPSGGFRLAAFAAAAGERVAWAAALRRLPVLIGPGRLNHHALIPQGATDDVRRLAEEAGLHLGVSSVFTDYRDVGAAAEEAARVFTAAQFSDRLWTEFEGTTISVLTRSHREAQEIIHGVLGSLAEDTAAAAKLRDTLFAYLRNDRHWQRTADELHIHRQTLAYRLNRIEQETGLSVTRTADLSALWIAYQSWAATKNES